jgi:hypothetical protein
MMWTILLSSLVPPFFSSPFLVLVGFEVDYIPDMKLNPEE